MLLFEAGLRTRVAENLAAFDPQRGSDVAEGTARPCAVVVCLVAGPHLEACYVVTRRGRHLSAHAGQFALPGGRVDPGEDPATAARRELAEEVGLIVTSADVLGDHVTRSGYLITPVVVWCEQAAALAPNPDEVAAAHLVPVAELDDPGAPHLLPIPESDRPVIQMPVMGRWIHAPTAAVLYQFREVALHGRPTRVRGYEQPVWAWR